MRILPRQTEPRRDREFLEGYETFTVGGLVEFERYIALGDSISIDRYPAEDLRAADPRRCGPGPRRGLGAASLLYHNDDEIWPEFRGRDLQTRFPGIHFRNDHDFDGPSSRGSDNLTTDGATIGTTLGQQLPNVAAGAETTLVTMTVGGNDLLQAIARADGPGPVAGMIAGLQELIDAFFSLRSNATVLLGTVYDPSDRTGILHGEHLPRQHRWLLDYNAAVRGIAARDERVLLADIEDGFFGHGEQAPPEDRWYWSGLIFEPNARGASEVRRLWLEALEL